MINYTYNNIMLALLLIIFVEKTWSWAVQRSIKESNTMSIAMTKHKLLNYGLLKLKIPVSKSGCKNFRVRGAWKNKKNPINQ